MKKYSGYLVFLLALTGMHCSSKTEPTPIVGCQVTFKSKAVSLPSLTCAEFSGKPSVSANNRPSEQELEIFYAAGATLTVTFVTNAGGQQDAQYSSTFGSSPPTVTVDGQKWTFSASLVNSSGDIGAISGTCNCTN